MSRRAYIYFVLTFVLGALVGAAGTFFYGWQTNHWRHPRHTPHDLVVFLQKQLNLSSDQTQQVSRLIEDWDRRNADLQKQIEPQFEAIRMETRDKIRKLLTPAQLEKYNEILRNYDAYRKSHPRQE
jgi:hypothetical protein